MAPLLILETDKMQKWIQKALFCGLGLQPTCSRSSVTSKISPNCTNVISLWPRLECWNILNSTLGHMYQVHFWKSPWFLNELGPCFASATKPWQFCVRLQQKRASEWAWMPKGTETAAVWAVGAVQTQTAHGALCETQGTNNTLTLQTLPAVQSELCVCVHASTRICTC